MPRRRWLPTLALLLCSALREVGARMLAPMRRQTAQGLLQRLTESSEDLLSIDIGGTLAKVVLFQPADGPPPAGETPTLDLGPHGSDAFGPEQLELSVYSPELRGNLHFFVFETRHVSDVLTFIGQHWSSTGSLESGQRPMLSLRATGGGAYKHADDFRKAGVHLTLDDEMSSMVADSGFTQRPDPLCVQCSMRLPELMRTVCAAGDRPELPPEEYAR